MKEIQLTKGKVTQVSDHRFEYLNQHKWQYHHSGYASRNKGKFILMHRDIMNAPVGMEVDHIDGNKLNNQDENLRICTRIQNQMNTPVQPRNASGFKGVFFKRKSWQAKIRFQGKDIYLGVFQTPELAAHAYNEAAKKYYGEFANLNKELK